MKARISFLILIVFSAPAYAKDTYSLSTGFEYTTGKYGGTTSTDILYIPVTGKRQSGKLILKVTVPYIRVTGAGGVILNVGQTGQATATKSTQSGMGDITASAAYNVYAKGNRLVDMVGKVKLGTADASKGLGTGENDYAAQVDGYQLVNSTTLFATAGYKVMGQPAGIILRDVLYGSVGASQKLDKDTSAGVMLDIAQSSNSRRSNRRELILYASQKIAPDLKLQGNLIKGLSDNSADFGVGITIAGNF